MVCGSHRPVLYFPIVHANEQNEMKSFTISSIHRLVECWIDIYGWSTFHMHNFLDTSQYHFVSNISVPNSFTSFFYIISCICTCNTPPLNLKWMHIKCYTLNGFGDINSIRFKKKRTIKEINIFLYILLMKSGVII